jgi:tRNA(Ile2) C34 agmatinyltransferase TiaS
MKPKFIEHIHLDIPKDLTPKENAFGDMVCSITNKIMFEQVEKIDNEICERIKDIALLNGIDEIYVIDRNAIISALEKQIPHKLAPKTSKGNEVPVCGKCNGIMDLMQGELNYCPKCGQALDWSDTE